MPLLDRLKNTSSPPDPVFVPPNTVEEWLSLSAAIGVEVDGRQQPASGGPGHDPMYGVNPHGDDGLWDRMIAVCPADLVDT